MLTYEKDIKPIKITAREAYKQSVETEEYLNTLRAVYSDIQGNIKDGYTNAHFFYDSMSLVNRVYRELLAQDYNLTLEKEKTCYHLTVDWSDVDLNPNKKYILPMDDVYSLDCYGNSLTGYAYKGTNGSWFMAVIGTNVNGEDIERLGYTVTAKDLEYAPEWVKVLEPVEVEG
ncbi:hypothetical protein [Limosilactobacillus reuteri]|uniref:DUF1642 domain-containing protein n=1 Tax=Limosilactobacillus reuteri TaxID=1598 RepID=A0ABD6Y3Z6_LIMRT|nr:hypothetical protein [Limosilactobacillus reuteri]PWT36334.1 hypothetical protein DKZ35_10940 [Limosilactobacillus reuteri]